MPHEPLETRSTASYHLPAALHVLIANENVKTSCFTPSLSILFMMHGTKMVQSPLRHFVHFSARIKLSFLQNNFSSLPSSDHGSIVKCQQYLFVVSCRIMSEDSRPCPLHYSKFETIDLLSRFQHQPQQQRLIMEQLVQQEFVSVKLGQLYVMMKRIREGKRWDIVASSHWRVRETITTTRVEEGENGNIVVEGKGQKRGTTILVTAPRHKNETREECFRGI